MRRLIGVLAPCLALLLGGCGSAAVSDTASPTATPPVSPTTATPAPTAAPTRVPATPRSVLPALPRSTATPGYRAFLASLCRSMAGADSSAVSNDLPYYQYNSGLRYGMIGDGEGQTADPGLLAGWLQGARVRCRYYTPDSAGHGTLLAQGFAQPAAWALIEADIYNGQWKINDFTFGNKGDLWLAMHTSHPILVYRG